MTSNRPQKVQRGRRLIIDSFGWEAPPWTSSGCPPPLQKPCLSAGPLPKPNDAQSLPPVGWLIFRFMSTTRNPPHLQGIEDGWQCGVELDLRCCGRCEVAVSVIGQPKNKALAAYYKITGQPIGTCFFNPQIGLLLLSHSSHFSSIPIFTNKSCKSPTT